MPPCFERSGLDPRCSYQSLAAHRLAQTGLGHAWFKLYEGGPPTEGHKRDGDLRGRQPLTRPCSESAHPCLVGARRKTGKGGASEAQGKEGPRPPDSHRCCLVAMVQIRTTSMQSQSLFARDTQMHIFAHLLITTEGAHAYTYTGMAIGGAVSVDALRDTTVARATSICHHWYSSAPYVCHAACGALWASHVAYSGRAAPAAARSR